MRPRDKGETTLMVCCGQEIECTLKAHQVGNRAVAIAMWKCEECLTAFWQRRAEIRPEVAEPICIEFIPVEPIKPIEEGKELRKQNFRVIEGSKK